MTVRIPSNVFEGLAKWMTRGPWPEHFQDAIDDHMGVCCQLHDIDSFEELADKIGAHWVTTLNDMALKDFLGRETEDGNAVDLYLKRRGWRETGIARAYMEGIRGSVVSLYEVSDIRPGDSFLARDLILGGEPVRVRERTATKSMAPWEQFAMRIVEVRGSRILAGGLLPFKPDLSIETIEEIRELAERTEAGVEEMSMAGGEEPPPEAIETLAMAITLKMASPLLAETWLMGTVLDPAETALPQLFNSDGDEIELIKLTCRFARGATQAKIRAVLDAQPDMAPASDKVWNWVDRSRHPLQPGLPEGGMMLKSELGDGSLVLGTITLKGRMLEADTNSARRAEALKARLAELVGALVQPPLMVRQTLAQAMAEHREKDRAPDPPDIPPEDRGAPSGRALRSALPRYARPADPHAGRKDPARGRQDRIGPRTGRRLAEITRTG